MKTYEPGDKVMVTRKIASHTEGWNNSWLGSMDKSIGKILTVVSDLGIDEYLKDDGVRLADGFGNYLYPRACLELITEKLAALLTVKDVALMTEHGRMELARWLEKCADDIVNHGEEYSPTVRFKYLYNEIKKDFEMGLGDEW